MSINLEVKLVVQTQEEVEGLVPAESCLEDREKFVLVGSKSV